MKGNLWSSGSFLRMMAQHYGLLHSISSDGGDPKISDGMSFVPVPMFDVLKFAGLLLIGVLVTIIVSSESSVSVGIVMGGVLNPIVSFPSDDVLDAVMGCASVPRKGTVKPEDVVSLFERLVDTRQLWVGKTFQFEDEFCSSFDPRTVSVFFLELLMFVDVGFVVNESEVGYLLLK